MTHREYCIEHRRLLFKDEWGFYIVLLGLVAANLHLNWPIELVLFCGAYGFLTIGTSYIRQWGMEREIQ